MADYRETLRGIRTFPSLIKFLRDELDWPIESDDFEEMTFTYTPEELGIESASAAKIQEIKRLRPLTANQPWGIFFVKFEPKKLPVVALRRILSGVVVKKRASANSAERAAWEAGDLLFISNYGEGEERRISFAHFSQHEEKADLPTLKVLGWDNLDTPLHLDDVADVLRERLSWPGRGEDADLWRERWCSAFTLRHREVITTSKALAVRLADLAKAIRKRIGTVLSIECENGPVTRLMTAFQKVLINDLTADDFADMYAQTITYGLLSARVANPAHDTADAVATQIPVTNPFLKELMETFLHVGGRKRRGRGGENIDFDELGVSDVVELLDAANMEAVVRDFGDRNRDEDPVIHFYELFLKEYDARKRMQRGVFYTPQPVVSYIVRSVHELVQREFGLEDGLAATATWREVIEGREGLQVPPGVSHDDAFVQVLDPATGTATFLVEVIEVIYQTLEAKWKKAGFSDAKRHTAWNEYVPKHLLPRIHGYELMMAPYAIAHMKIGLKLYETGYRFESDARARVYLTNALDAQGDIQQVMRGIVPALAHEAQAVNAVKRERHFTVVIGNPPYAKLSSNRGNAAEALVQPFKAAVRAERNIQPLSDDYVKFLGLAVDMSKRVGMFAFGMITNRGYVSGLIHRGVRQVIFSNWQRLWLVDLHGDSNVGELAPDGSANENVFDIQQGVAITLGVKTAYAKDGICRYDAWGTRSEKYVQLGKLDVAGEGWTACKPEQPNFFFQVSVRPTTGMEVSVALDAAMPATNTGIKTHRDGLVIDFDSETLVERIRRFADARRGDASVRAEFFGVEAGGRYKPGDNRDWSMVEARKALQREAAPLKDFIRELDYRPFDCRSVFYSPAVIDFAREDLMQHMAGGRNIGLIATRQVPNGAFCHVFVTRRLVEMKACSHDRGTNLFPLWLRPEKTSLGVVFDARPNFSGRFVEAISSALALPRTGEHGMPEGLSPEQVLGFIYATLYSPGYRRRYAESLKIGFPAVPLPGSLDLFRALACLGADLIALHLMESPRLAKILSTYTGPKNPEVEKVSYLDGSVLIDKTGTAGFGGVPVGVWEFRVGGYQVCEKWLKDRKGRVLSKDDIVHYQKIVVALAETIRLMKEIDEAIEQRGGWPGAFFGNLDKKSRDYPEAGDGSALAADSPRRTGKKR